MQIVNYCRCVQFANGEDRHMGDGPMNGMDKSLGLSFRFKRSYGKRKTVEI